MFRDMGFYQGLNSLVVIVALVVLALTTSISSYPASSYGQQGYRYQSPYGQYDDLLQEEDPQEQWSIAQEPAQDNYYDDYLPLPDYEDLSNFLEFYDNSQKYNQYQFDSNSAPESELEHLRDISQPIYRPAIPLVQTTIPTTTTTRATTTTTTTMAPTKAPKNSKKQKGGKNKNKATTPAPYTFPTLPQQHQSQPEVAFLRPPVTKPQKNTQNYQNQLQDLNPHQYQFESLNQNQKQDKSQEPIISKISPDKKPSAYDTLRKYLVLEDEMKKEAVKVKRRSSSRYAKRSFVADEESLLSGELNKLKKNF